MNAKDLLKHNIRFSQMVTKSYVEDVTDDEMLVRALPGSNHLAWQLGHLVASERSLYQMVGCEMPGLPEGFEAVHGTDNTESDDPSQFLSKAEYLSMMETMHAAAEAAIDTFDEADLDKPSPEKVRSFFPTVGSVLFMAGGHEMMHAGQIAAIRRKLGKPVVI
jgi:hypothetical protein